MRKIIIKYLFICVASILIFTSFSINTFAEVWGNDTRTRVTETTAEPNRAIVQLYGVANNEYICTGAMVGPKTLVTAAHCVIDGTRTMTVSPGKNETKNPYGIANIRQVHISPDYVTGRSSNDDWAVINIDKELGNKTGWFNYNTGLPSGDIAVTGYPIDKGGSQMWTGKGRIQRTSGNTVYHDVDTNGGQSGAPIYHNNVIYAIHGGATRSITLNHGARINQDVIDAINQMRQQ
ncbi:trypsin-like serine peptidase [Bacillus thuringiensis]|uniref:Serine protease n=1 Tax=Bacillus thuringiensis TaxID=1428 RepID=A0ABD6R590_BACTU|nr:trypsin-like serine protease [Bacillus thuringiensis]OPD49282.1 hypothetical protein BVF97_19830 [Bacillus thuringiensis]